MSGAAPLPPQGPLNLAALRLVEGAQALPPALATPAGAELLATLLEAGPEGLLLQLADGRKLTATGELPYAPGTRFAFRLQSLGEGLLHLQPLRADPPARPALVAPLLQGEASALLQRLAAPQGEPGLVALRALLRSLQPPVPPEAEPLLRTLQAALPEGGARPGLPDLAAALRAAGWPDVTARAWGALLSPDPGGDPGSAPEPALPRPTAALLRALGLPEALGQGLEGPAGDPLPAALAQAKELLARIPPSLAQRALALLSLLPESARTFPLPADHPLARLVQALLPDLRSALAAEGAPAAQPPGPQADPAHPEAWSGWLKGVLETLGRPESSPAQAPAHALQAREGTALFQVPLPWPAAQGHLEIWAEREPGGPGNEPVDRVLLALSFQAAGDLRVGLQAGPGGIRAQVLAEPDKAPALEAALRAELGSPPPFPVLVKAPDTLPPRPLVQAGGGVQALG